MESTMSDEIEFTDDQQSFIDKLVGKARISAREKAESDAQSTQAKVVTEAERTKLEADENWKKLVDLHVNRVQELEPYEAEAKAYRELIAGMLKDRTKELGDGAKKAVAALPDSLTDLERLNWLNQNQALFETESTLKVGTPAKRKKLTQLTDKGREGHRTLRL